MVRRSTSKRRKWVAPTSPEAINQSNNKTLSLRYTNLNQMGETMRFMSKNSVSPRAVMKTATGPQLSRGHTTVSKPRKDAFGLPIAEDP